MNYSFPGDILLGYTYDVFGEYASHRSRLKQVLQAGEVTFPTDIHVPDRPVRLPAGVTLNFLSEQQGFKASGEDFSEFTADLAAHVSLGGSGGGFFGKTSASFKGEVRADSSTMYAFRVGEEQRYLATLDVQKAKLDPTFLKDLNNADFSPKRFFQTYGTHLVTGLFMGGSTRYLAYSQKTSSYGKAQFEADVEAHYLKMVNTSASTSGEGTKTSRHVIDATELQIMGGSVAGQSALRKGPEGYDAWAASVASMPDVVDFHPNGLRALWELCTEDSRRHALHAAFAELYSPRRKTAHWRQISGSGYEVTLHSDDPYLVVTGCGLREEADDFASLQLEFQDMRTGQREWQRTGQDFKNGTWGSVPFGSAVTGIALKVEEGHAVALRLYYQLVQIGVNQSGSAVCLDPTIYHLDVHPNGSDWQGDSRTARGNTEVFAGVQARCTHHKVSGLAAYHAPLYLPINTLDD